jgi:hypothetical protein
MRGLQVPAQVHKFFKCVPTWAKVREQAAGIVIRFLEI